MTHLYRLSTATSAITSTRPRAQNVTAPSACTDTDSEGVACHVLQNQQAGSTALDRLFHA